MLLHRYVMEAYLGRKLLHNEVIHHIDGDKHNNDIANLILVTHREHSVIHNQKYPLIKLCEVCGYKFIPVPTKRKRQKTCSYNCMIELMKRNSKSAKINAQQREQIKVRYNNGDTGVCLADEYGITPQAISYIIHH